MPEQASNDELAQTGCQHDIRVFVANLVDQYG